MFTFAGKQLEYGKRATVEGWARLVDGDLYLIDMDSVDLKSLVDADGNVRWELMPRILVSDQRIAFALRKVLPGTAGIRSPFCDKVIAKGVLSLEEGPVLRVDELSARDPSDSRLGIHYISVGLNSHVLEALEAEEEAWIRENMGLGYWDDIPAYR